MQIDRLFMITYYLLNHRGTTAKELSERFEVSVRTILRDIEILGSAGIPIYTSQGTGGGIFLDKDYVFNKTALTDEEQDKILLALLSISGAGQFRTDALVNKLSNLFSKNYSDIVEIDFSRWGKTHTDKAKFEELMSAIAVCRKVSFSYINMYTEKSNRVVCPTKLKFQSKAWYLQGYDVEKSGYRTFKLNRLSEMRLLDEDFNRSELPTQSAPEQKRLPLQTTHLKLRFSSDVAHRLYDDFEAEEIIRENSGFCTVNADMPETDWLYGYLLSFGNDVEIIAPEHIKNKICETASRILKKYAIQT